MSHEEKELQADDSADRHEAKLKPYIKPAFRFEHVFVTTALSCGKTPSTPLFSCQTNKKVS